MKRKTSPAVTPALEVLGFPANDFKEQEPGSDTDISQFCSLNYDVHFPLFSKKSQCAVKAAIPCTAS